MKLFIAFVALIVASRSESGSPFKDLGNKGRIAHGQNAHPKQFPYAVLMEITTETQRGTCGGTLIGTNWFLTAAHCVDQAIYAIVYLGLIFTDYAEISYFVRSSNIVIHPQWNRDSFVSDIALVRIPTTVNCELVEFVKLPKMVAATRRNYTGFGIISGWGDTSDNGNIAYRLQWARMLLISNEVCEQFDVPDLTDKICADTTGASPCDGDSGGPLVLEDTEELIGVISGISNCGIDSRHPAIFTRVSLYLEWIKSETGIYY